MHGSLADLHGLPSIGEFRLGTALRDGTGQQLEFTRQ
jgi:hypothetical protein